MKNRSGGDDALVFGQLAYLDEVQCFVLDWEAGVGNGAQHFAVVWPEATEPIRRDNGEVGVDVAE